MKGRVSIRIRYRESGKLRTDTGNDIGNMVPEPRGRGAMALRFRRVRPLAREAVETLIFRVLRSR